ncbi:RskA family anti-sigma factor [Nocardia sp. NBC_00511]|uniref:RskA family anti-sigma factor n=1 Tax=Nocardia sp. NBC_00511 TaxID=2903591 RepID=UPI0030E566F5
MTVDVPADADLLDLAYVYAMDAVTELERAVIQRRRALADPATAAAFDAVVSRVQAALALVSRADSCPPPAGLEARLLGALDQLGATHVRVDTEPPERSSHPGWLCAVAVVLVVLGLSAGLVERGAFDPGSIGVARAAVAGR